MTYFYIYNSVSISIYKAFNYYLVVKTDIFMKSIYNIYERMYRGILAGMDDVMSNGEKIAKDINNSFKERLIKIISLSAHLSEEETLVLRELLKSASEGWNLQYASCVVPKTLRDSLIVASKRKLKVKDFNGILTDTKEYNARCSFDYMRIESAATNAFDKSTIDNLKSNKGKLIKVGPNRLYGVALGDLIAYHDDDMIYIVIGGIYRIIVRFFESPHWSSIKLSDTL